MYTIRRWFAAQFDLKFFFDSNIHSDALATEIKYICKAMLHALQKKTSCFGLPLSCIVHSSGIWWLSLLQFSQPSLRELFPSKCEISKECR